MLKRLFHRQEGDTIVEVLIALAILTLVLGGAYYTASLSFRNDRDAQEHTEALAVAQAQLEELRAYGDSFDSTKYQPNNSCLEYSSGSLTPTTNCQLPSNNTSTNYDNCPVSSATPFCYGVSITGPTTISVNQSGGGQTVKVNLNTYKINVNWTALGGGNDDVSLYYRVDAS